MTPAARLQAAIDTYPARAFDRFPVLRPVGRAILAFLRWRLYCATVADTPERHRTVARRWQVAVFLWSALTVLAHLALLAVHVKGWSNVLYFPAFVCLVKWQANLSWVDGYKARDREGR